MKKTQLMALVMVLVMTTFMTGCGGKEETARGKKVVVDAPVDADGKVYGLMYKEGLPIVDPGDYTFTVFTDGSKTTDEYYLISVLEEQTGVHMEVELNPYEVAKEKYSLSLNSGDYADSIGGWILTATDILKFGVGTGTFIPLEEYIAEFAPNIEAVLNLEGVREQMTAPDGHIYSIPYVLTAPAIDFSPYINTRWLENVGMEVPTTTDEFEQVLIAFKEQDANRNGDAGDEIPFALDPHNKHLGYFAGWFGLPTNDKGFTMTSGELEFGADDDEYKTSIEYLARLYAQGLIDPELFTQDIAQFKAKGTQDIYGVAMMYSSLDVMPIKLGATPEWVPLPVLKGEGVDKPLWFRNTYGTAVLKNQVVVTDNAKNPEIIVRWWDNMFELENSIQTNGGPLDIKVFKTDNGYIIDESNMTDEQKDIYSWNNLYPQSLPRYIPTDFRFEEKVKAFPEKDNVDAAYAANLVEKTIPSYWSTEEESERLSELDTSITDYLAGKVAEWVSGQADINEEWDGYKAQLQKFNLDEYIKIRKDSIN